MRSRSGVDPRKIVSVILLTGLVVSTFILGGQWSQERRLSRQRDEMQENLGALKERFLELGGLKAQFEQVLSSREAIVQWWQRLPEDCWLRAYNHPDASTDFQEMAREVRDGVLAGDDFRIDEVRSELERLSYEARFQASLVATRGMEFHRDETRSARMVGVGIVTIVLFGAMLRLIRRAPSTT